MANKKEIKLVIKEGERIVDSLVKEITSTDSLVKEITSTELLESIQDFQKVANDTLTKLIAENSDTIEVPFNDDEDEESDEGDSVADAQASPKKRKL